MMPDIPIDVFYLIFSPLLFFSFIVLWMLVKAVKMNVRPYVLGSSSSVGIGRTRSWVCPIFRQPNLHGT